MRQTIVSGVPYAVTTIDGRQPLTLDDFIGAHCLLLTHQEHESSVDGLGSRIGPAVVLFHEKSGDLDDRGGVSGPDAREWKVTGHVDTGFCAEHQAKF